MSEGTTEHRPHVRLPRMLRIAVAMVTLLALGTGSGIHLAAAQQAPTSAQPAAPPALIPADLEADAVPVTLITGDIVHWLDAGDGSPRLDIEQAPRDHPVTFDQSGTPDDFYVIPSDVMAHVVAGRLDEDLFNVPGLIRQGLDDESTGGQLPLIVVFEAERTAAQLERDADALPATEGPVAVERLNAAGISVARGQAAQFRNAVFGNGNRRGGGNGPAAQAAELGAGVEQVLLDRVLHIDLAESVPQIGAPAAWEAGYTGEGVTVAVLDTGIDTSHPDLAGQVVAVENFTNEPDASDTHGHGTHVAATIAGSGAASDGARRGVAPDAELVSGKVCDAAGQCQTSWIMAGMEWATTTVGADVVNMSLGGAPTDGSDPLSQLVNQLSADTGALFVISAGNSGFGDFFKRVVGSPAAADAALAVGAVDKSDQMASFSSRGPRLGDHAVKPEITAPGVGIVAARAEGTSLGSPVDENYTSLNGTSMAAPHVAGAAALLAQAHPDLGGQALKDALVSTAADGGFRWYQQGTGRVDVSAALDSPVYAAGTVNLGGINGQAEQEIVYSNQTDDAMTLTLQAAATGLGGQPYDGIILSDDTLTVPADGYASVTVTVVLDASSLTSQESFGGVVTATGADDLALRTAIGFGPPLHRVAIEVRDSSGEHSEDAIVWLTHDTLDREVGGQEVYRFGGSEGIAVGHVPTGTYTIISIVEEFDPAAPLERTRMSLLVEVEVDIAANTTITLDARGAVPIEVSVPRKADKRNHEAAVIRELAGSGGETFTLEAHGGSWPLYASPAPPGKLAPISLFVSWTLAEPQPTQPLPWDNTGLCPRIAFRCYSETPAYIYNLPILYENGIPHSLHERITRPELVEVPTRFHSDHSDAFIMQRFESRLPVQSVGIADQVQVWFQPGEVTEYVLANDRFAWTRLIHIERRPVGEPAQDVNIRSDDWFPAAEAGSRRSEERWHEAPLRLGMWDLREETLNTPWLADRTAPASRNGVDGEWFAAPFQRMGNNRGHGADTSTASYRMWNVDTGVELERTGRLFPLAPEEAAYRLQQVASLPPTFPFLTGQDTTIWTFTSRPSDEPVPERYRCPVRQAPREDICQIQPLILLEYALGLDINNRVPAGRAHVFTVTAGHHSKAIDRSKVTELAVQASFDDGQTWTDARIVDGPRDSFDAGGFLPAAAPRQQFRVELRIPPLADTNGFVSLRVQASDANGGTVDQTIQRAYTLKAP